MPEIIFLFFSHAVAFTAGAGLVYLHMSRRKPAQEEGRAEAQRGGGRGEE